MIRRLPQRGAHAAEVGVWKGVMARHVLASGRLAAYHLVDPWTPGTPGTSWYESNTNLPRFSASRFRAAMAEVKALAAEHDGVALITRAASLDAARDMPAASLDAVFLDADHSREGLAADIEAWTPKVRPGGWIGGHDLDHPRFPGVREAVDAAFGERIETGADRTWWVRIP